MPDIAERGWGRMDTSRDAASLADAECRARSLSRITAGRLGTAKNRAGAALSLRSDAAASVTGATVPVDGGLAP